MNGNTSPYELHEPPYSMIKYLLKENGMGGLKRFVRSGDWLVFPNVISEHYVAVFEDWRYHGSVRLRIAINLRKSWETIQQERRQGLDEFGKPVTSEMADKQGMRAPIHFYSYTLMEATASLDIWLDIYVTHRMPFEALKGFDLVVPDDNDFAVYGQDGGFAFVDQLLREAQGPRG